jgi:hypothetical protein
MWVSHGTHQYLYLRNCSAKVSFFWLSPTKPPLSWLLQKKAQTLPPQCCSAMQPFKKLSLRSSCQLFARLRCRPARATASNTSISPWARVAAVESFLLLSLGHYSAATHAQVGHTVIDSHHFSESLMKGRRALPTAEALTGQKPRQRLSHTECFKHQRIARFMLPNAQPT